MRRIDLLDHLIMSGGFSVPDLQSSFFNMFNGKLMSMKTMLKKFFEFSSLKLNRRIIKVISESLNNLKMLRRSGKMIAITLNLQEKDLVLKVGLKNPGVILTMEINLLH